MVWLALALAASLIAAWALFSRNMDMAGVVLLAAAFGLVALLGRGIEGRRDDAWQEAAAELHAKLRSAPPLAFIGHFGPPAPWIQWARDGDLQVRRAIDGSTADPPFALLHVRYSVRQDRGETSSEDWYDVAVAVAGIPEGRRETVLQPVVAAGEHAATHNGEFLFLWKKGQRGAGEMVAPTELPALLQHARGLASAQAGVTR